MVTFAKDEMLQNAAFYQGLHCFFKSKTIFRERNAILFVNHKLWPLNIYNR